MRLTSVVAVSALVASVAAVPKAGFMDGLLRRQTDASGDCTNTCTSVQSATTACGTDESCLCTSAIATPLLACSNCAASADPSTASEYQQSLDGYSEGCDAAGFNVGNLTLTISSGAASAGTAPATLSGAASSSVASAVSSITAAVGSSASAAAASHTSTASTSTTKSAAESINHGKVFGAGILVTFAVILVTVV